MADFTAFAECGAAIFNDTADITSGGVVTTGVQGAYLEAYVGTVVGGEKVDRKQNEFRALPASLPATLAIGDTLTINGGATVHKIARIHPTRALTRLVLQ